MAENASKAEKMSAIEKLAAAEPKPVTVTNADGFDVEVETATGLHNLLGQGYTPKGCTVAEAIALITPPQE